MSPFGPLDTLDSGDGSHRCPVCGNPTVYQAFSGGKEWYCKTCDKTGPYPPTMPSPPRATLLQTLEGREELRSLMREAIRDRLGGEA